MIHQVPMSRLYKDVSEKVETRWKQLYSQDGPHFEGEYCKQAERLLSNITERKYAFITTSGTASIHVMLLAQGIEPGDEVICVNHSAPATAMAIASLGAKPVFVDLNEYGSMDCDQISSVVTNKTKAILATGLYGDSYDHDKIKNIGVPILNDSCQSWLAKYKGVENAKLGIMSIVSFSSNKICPVFGTYGAVLTDDDEMAEKIKLIRRNGYAHRDVPNGIKHLGINAQPYENKCIEVLSSLEMLSKWQKIRSQISEKYDTAFEGKVKTRPKPSYSQTNYHKYTVMIPNKQLAYRKLLNLGIEARMHYTYDFSKVPVFKSKQSNQFPYTEKFIDEALSIPCSPWLNEQEQNFIIDKVIKVANGQIYSN